MSGSGISRRRALQFLGGGALGAMATPLPWKLLDDVAIWSQNGPNAVEVPRGAMHSRFSHCCLCPAGCGLRLRCAGERVVGIAPVAGHPRGGGGICMLGLAAHHLAYHPHRLRTATWQEPGTRVPQPLDLEGATTILTQWAAQAQRAGDAVAVLDLRPERPVGTLYRRWLAPLRNGLYLVRSGDDAAGPCPPAGMLGTECPALGLDLARVRTVISFGAPVLDGWVAPGRLHAVWDNAATPGARRFHLVQIESRPSRTALQADRWLALRPGSEAALALGLAHAVVAAQPNSAALGSATDAAEYVQLLQEFTPERVAELTGIDAATIRDVAVRCVQDGAAVAIAGVDPGRGAYDRPTRIAIWGLNFLLGAATPAGAYVVRAPLPGDPIADLGVEAPPVVELASAPRASVRLLVIDASASDTAAIPWDLVRRVLAPDARIVCLATHAAGLARRADLVLPAPAPFENWDEVTGPADAAAGSYALAAPIVAPRAPALEPAAFLGWLAAATTPASRDGRDRRAWRQRRIAAIHAAARGELFRPATAERLPLSTVGSPAELERELAAGACWVDATTTDFAVPSIRLLGGDSDGGGRLRVAGLEADRGAANARLPLVLVPFASGAEAAHATLPPVVDKAYRESNLRPAGGVACVHPETAAECGLAVATRALLETVRGAAPVRLQLDPAVPRGVVHAAIGPDASAFGDDGPAAGAAVLGLCAVADDGTWNRTPATLRRAPNA